MSQMIIVSLLMPLASNSKKMSEREKDREGVRDGRNLLSPRHQVVSGREWKNH